MIYSCCQENRRNAVAAHPTLNGIDHLEVLDRDSPVQSLRQRTLMLHLLKPVPPGWTRDNVSIRGGERIRDPGIEWVAPADNLPVSELEPAEIALLSALPDAGSVLIIRTDTDGDYSDYTLSLREGGALPPIPPLGFDPRLVEVVFSFKVECHSDFDCASSASCDEPALTEPDLNYLAKDYASFRQLVLDRMSHLLPDWRSRSAADLGVTLAELVAYIGDELSYWQDAVTTEAYLHTARKRVSLRRHALLVDYRIGEGRNARAWLHLEVTGGPFELPAEGVQFLSRVEGLRVPGDNRIEPDSKQHVQARQQNALVFELLSGNRLVEDHNRMLFYTWGDDNCCLPTGATHATLLGHYPDLAVAPGEPGLYLLFEEEVGPLTGAPEDANPARRQVVRLTDVALTGDPLDGTEITEIFWAAEDALTFPLCISSQANSDTDDPLVLEEVSICRGNIVLVDHGETVAEKLPDVPQPWLYYPADRDSDHCSRTPRQAIVPRYRPRLEMHPLAHGAAAPANGQPAAGVLLPDPITVKPLIVEMMGDDGLGPQPWSVQPDLLNASADDPHFVVEMDNEGVAMLRFGDDRHGARPQAGTQFDVRYRVGNGPTGNVGADSIRHVVSLDGRILSVRNPLPARGGLAPENPAQIRRRAPQAFRTQLRAVTSEDYANFTAAHPGVQQAAAKQRWTGSWYTQTITVDREGGQELDPAFETGLAAGLERYRMAGQDLNFNNPVFVSLQLEMQICVSRDYFRSDVERALLDSFTSGLRADGTPGLFHPDKFTFSQTVYLSPIYARARQVSGVSSVHITHFSRQGEEDIKALSDGFMSMGEFEIARLDNDPNFPEHGVLKLTMLGGK